MLSKGRVCCLRGGVLSKGRVCCLRGGCVV